MTISLGMGTSIEFFTEEFCALNLKDKRLNERAKRVFVTLQSKLGSCIRRLFIDPEDFDKDVHQHHRSIKDKATRYWIDALVDMRQRLGECSQRIITVADRESDFYEFLHELIEAKEEFVIRAKHDRYTGKTHRARELRLWSLLTESESTGCMTTIIQDVNSRETKEITLTLKAIEVMLPPPNKGKKDHDEKKDVHPIKINVVMAYNDEHEWVLLTKLPINTLDQIEEIVSIYRAR